MIYPKGSEAVITDNFDGKGYGRPNDLVVSARAACISASPGPTRPPGPPPPDAAAPARGLLRPARRQGDKVADGIERPNGIMLSRDEKTLYVNNSNGEYLLAFDVKPDGTVGNRRNFAKYQGGEEAAGAFISGADGLAIDNEGRVYTATAAGVEVFSPKGETSATIPLSRAPQNIAFAGNDKKTLYIVGRGSAFKVRLLAAGFKGRAK